MDDETRSKILDPMRTSRDRDFGCRATLYRHVNAANRTVNVPSSNRAPQLKASTLVFGPFENTEFYDRLRTPISQIVKVQNPFIYRTHKLFVQITTN